MWWCRRVGFASYTVRTVFFRTYGVRFVRTIWNWKMYDKYGNKQHYSDCKVMLYWSPSFLPTHVRNLWECSNLANEEELCLLLFLILHARKHRNRYWVHTVIPSSSSFCWWRTTRLEIIYMAEYSRLSIEEHIDYRNCLFIFSEVKWFIKLLCCFYLWVLFCIIKKSTFERKI